MDAGTAAARELCGGWTARSAAGSSSGRDAPGRWGQAGRRRQWRVGRCSEQRGTWPSTCCCCRSRCPPTRHTLRAGPPPGPARDVSARVHHPLVTCPHGCVQVASLKAERAGTEGLVSEMGSKQAQLQAWLDRNEPKAATWKEVQQAAAQGGGMVEWERYTPAMDELSRQAMETQARGVSAIVRPWAGRSRGARVLGAGGGGTLGGVCRSGPHRACLPPLCPDGEEAGRGDCLAQLRRRSGRPGCSRRGTSRGLPTQRRSLFVCAVRCVACVRRRRTWRAGAGQGAAGGPGRPHARRVPQAGAPHGLGLERSARDFTSSTQPGSARERHAAQLTLGGVCGQAAQALTRGVAWFAPQVRLLCRKQFFARALGLKVAEVQRQQPPPPPRPGPYSGVSRPTPIAHGDSWMNPSDAARLARGAPPGS